MRYISTRGDGEPCSFLEAIGRGRAADGGVHLPQDWPRLTAEDVMTIGRRSLAETAALLLGRFAGRQLDPELAASAAREACTLFPHPAVTPLRELDQNLWLLDAAQGPTRCAADFEMQVLARVMDRALICRGGSKTLLLATTGDDGPAAVEAFRDRAGLGLVVLFPRDGVTRRQRLAITDPAARNVRAVEVDGSYADCRHLVAAVMNDEALVHDTRLASIGPETIGRSVLQMALLLAASARLGAPDRALAFAVPGGDFSLGFAAWALTQLGAPVHRVLAVAEAADPLSSLFESRRFTHGSGLGKRSLDQDWAPGFERLYFEASGRRAVETARAARAFATTGGVDLPPAIQSALAGVLAGEAADPNRAAATSMAARNIAGEALDGQTAALVSAARGLASGINASPVIVLNMAHPAWSQADDAQDPPALLARLDTVQPRCERLAPTADALRAYVRAFAGLSQAA